MKVVINTQHFHACLRPTNNNRAVAAYPAQQLVHICKDSSFGFRLFLSLLAIYYGYFFFNETVDAVIVSLFFYRYCGYFGN